MKTAAGVLLGVSFAGAGLVTGLMRRSFAGAFRRERKVKSADWYAGEENPYRELFLQGKQWASDHREICSRKVICNQGIRLVGYYYDQKASRTVIFVHGFDSSYLERLSNAQTYYERGYNVLSVVCRGHGESGGEYRTMGYLDRTDVICWARYLVRQLHQKYIVLDGVSMGAATVLAAAGDPQLPEEVVGVVADSAYTSIYDIFSYQIGKNKGLPLFPLMNLIEAYCKNKVGISLIANSPLESVRVTKVPILFIHGVDDSEVPYEMGRKLRQVCASSRDMLSVKGAGHGEACLADPRGYQDSIERFLEKIEV